MKPFTFFPGESFNGAVARWADEVGGVERMIDITSVAGVAYGHVQRASFADEESIRALAAEMGVDPQELLARATPGATDVWSHAHHPIRFAGATVPSVLIEKRVRRFSPSALAMSPHHRAIWDVRLIPACTVTGEILLRSCGDPGCGPTGWTATLGINHCEHCMADLTAIRTDRIGEDDRLALGEVAALFSHDETQCAASLRLLPRDIAWLDVGDVVALITRIAPVVDRSLPLSLAGLLAAPPGQLSAAVAKSWRIMRGWPDALGDLAAKRVSARSGRHNDGNGGRTMRFLTRKRHSGTSPAVLDVVEDWRRSRNVEADEGAAMRARTLPGSEVSRITGMDSGRLVEHRRDGLFKIHFVLDRERPEARYDKAEIIDLNAAVADRCSAAATAAALGTSSHGVEQLAAMRLLHVLDHPVVLAHYDARQMSGSSLSQLVEAIKATAESGRTAKTVTLRNAMKAVGGRPKPWGPAYAMLLNGELPYCLASGDLPLSDLVLVDASAASILASLFLHEDVAAKLSPLMSKIDAGELLNLNPKRTTAVLAGYETGAGSHAKAVPLEAVLRIARRHISAAEIAARRGVTTACARSDAFAAGVPELGPAGFDRLMVEREFF